MLSCGASDFYRLALEEIAANAVLRTTRGTIEQAIAEYADLDIDEVDRLADIIT
ncbi:hypothetical protein [Amycolatopsis sp. cmx-11-51]|uniref:hypothetical protein n=1 Tax=unclassified Amycolatopsis TaxID=2618356 RepID=UPI0039E6B84A